MAAAQVVVIALLFAWGRPLHALAICGLLLVQLVMMARLLRRPAELDYWYNATGVPLYVAGMLVSAFAVRTVLT
jgi:chlorophyll synthase